MQDLPSVTRVTVTYDLFWLQLQGKQINLMHFCQISIQMEQMGDKVQFGEEAL